MGTLNASLGKGERILRDCFSKGLFHQQFQVTILLMVGLTSRGLISQIHKKKVRIFPHMDIYQP